MSNKINDQLKRIKIFNNGWINKWIKKIMVEWHMDYWHKSMDSTVRHCTNPLELHYRMSIGGGGGLVGITDRGILVFRKLEKKYCKKWHPHQNSFVIEFTIIRFLDKLYSKLFKSFTGFVYIRNTQPNMTYKMPTNSSVITN